MNHRLRLLLPLVVLVLSCSAAQQIPQWRQLDDGLELGRFKARHYAVSGDSVVHVLRIDPGIWDLRPLSLTGTGERLTLTAREWSARHNLTAVINAGMFHTDYKTHSGYMRCGDDVNNPQSNSYKSVAAFGPRREGLPPFRIFDIDTTAIAALAEDYSCLVQNLRLIDRARKNRWTPQGERWAEAALAEDGQGRALFLFCRSPYSMHDFNSILLSLPLDIVAAQHLEGGTEAQFYVRSAGIELELAGDSETDLTRPNATSKAWPIPNVIGISRK